jgi:hypothetical protein
MKQKLFNLLPSWLRQWKHADKLAHAIYGVLIYLSLLLVIPAHWSLFITYLIGIGVEIYDGNTKGNKPDVFDYFATIIIPTILYLIKP